MISKFTRNKTQMKRIYQIIRRKYRPTKKKHHRNKIHTTYKSHNSKEKSQKDARKEGYAHEKGKSQPKIRLKNEKKDAKGGKRAPRMTKEPIDARPVKQKDRCVR